MQCLVASRNVIERIQERITALEDATLVEWALTPIGEAWSCLVGRAG